MKNIPKRFGTILNLIFLINWTTFLAIIIYIYKNIYEKHESFPQWLTILCSVLPFILLSFLSFYIYLVIFKIKNYEKLQQKKSQKYLIVIITFASLTILSSLIILLANLEQYIILAIALYLSISFIFAIATLIIDALFFMQRLKWETIILKETTTSNSIDVIEVKNKE